MKLNNTILKTAIAASLAFAGVSAQAAVSLPNFTVDPTVGGTAQQNFPGIGLNPFSADRINGSYNETLTFGAVGNTFETSVFWTASVFRTDDDGNDVGPGTTGVQLNYGLYVLFQGSGTYTTSASGQTYNFNNGGNFSFYYDDYNSSVVGGGVTGWTNPANGSLPYGLTNTADDTLLFSGSLFGAPGSQGFFINGPGQNTGSFGTTGNLTLTEAGKKFFINPVPFYTIALTSGDFTKFTPAPGATINNVTGKMSVDFNRVPEPEVLSLLGIGLLGLGFNSRKKA